MRVENDFINLGFSLYLRFPLWCFYQVIKEHSDSSSVTVVNIEDMNRHHTLEEEARERVRERSKLLSFTQVSKATT